VRQQGAPLTRRQGRQRQALAVLAAQLRQQRAAAKRALAALAPSRGEALGGALRWAASGAVGGSTPAEVLEAMAVEAQEVQLRRSELDGRLRALKK
jgi:hypothetical protein